MYVCLKMYRLPARRLPPGNTASGFASGWQLRALLNMSKRLAGLGCLQLADEGVILPEIRAA
jgi:hypothetical protein